jgi:hypothetical protein
VISSPAAPAWAVELVTTVCAEAGVAAPRTFTWRRRRGEGSTGVTQPGVGAIRVRAGTDPLDQRLTLLHELGHWLAPRARTRRRGSWTSHHGRAFYAIAFRLYERHGIGPDEALRLEGSRYPDALRHALVLGVPGADGWLAWRRAALRARPRRTWRVLVPEHAVRLERDGRWTVCAICRHRIVGAQLARLRRRRTPARHVLWTSA